MGRRSQQALPADPRQARLAVARHFRRLTGKAGVNLAQFRAQMYEEEMIDFLRDVVLSNDAPLGLKISCAKDVLTYARGPLTPWAHDGQTIDPEEPTPEGTPEPTIGAQIEAARALADLHTELDDLVRRRVPPEHWPKRIQEAMGDAATYFAEVEEIESSA